MNQLVPYAQVLGPLVTAIAFLAGLWQFRRTQLLSREAKAIDLFLKFNELKDQLAKRETDKLPEAAFWQHNALLAITEAVFRLTEGDRSWEATVDWMLKSQQWFLTQTSIVCASYSARFVARMRRVVPDLRCA
jgi:hypothetical protein